MRTSEPLVPDGFVIPLPPQHNVFVLEPLGSRHNALDHQAWTTSIEHIRATPGFAGRTWPSVVESADNNHASLVRHEEDFAQRTGFSYAVLARDNGAFLGCVYFYPPRTADFDVDVRSWVRAESAELDKPLYDYVCAWLTGSWPWSSPDYAPR